MNTKKIIMFSGIVLLTIVALFFLIAKAPIPVRIGYLPISSHLPVYIAKEEGFFTKRKVEVELILYKDSSSLVAGVLNGNIDMAYECATDVALNAMLRDAAAFKIYQIALSKGKAPLNSFLVPTNSKAVNIERLVADAIKSRKKLKIGVFPGPTARVFVETILDKVSKSDPHFLSEIVSVPPGQPQLDILKTNRVDLLFTYDPFSSLIVFKKAGRELLQGPVEKYLIDPWPGGIGIIGTRFINTSPDTSSKVIQAIYQAFDFTENNEAKARDYLTKFSRLPKSVAKDVNFTSHIKLNTNFDQVILAQYVEMLAEWKILDKRVSLDEAYISSAEK